MKAKLLKSGGFDLKYDIDFPVDVEVEPSVEFANAYMIYGEDLDDIGFDIPMKDVYYHFEEGEEIMITTTHNTENLQVRSLNMFMNYLGYMPCASDETPSQGYIDFTNKRDVRHLGRYISMEKAITMHNTHSATRKLVHKVKIQRDRSCEDGFKVQSHLVKLTYAGKLYLGEELSLFME